MKYFYPLLAVLFLSITGCTKPAQTETQATKDENIIIQYIKDNNLTATKTSSGLYIVKNNAGYGATPTSSSTVKVYYKGTLTNGTVFDESANTGVDISLATTIKGWQEGIPDFKKGGKGMLLIPSALGYGTTAKSNIPANSVLIFEINLMDVY